MKSNKGVLTLVSCNPSENVDSTVKQDGLEPAKAHVFTCLKGKVATLNWDEGLMYLEKIPWLIRNQRSLRL